MGRDSVCREKVCTTFWFEFEHKLNPTHSLELDFLIREYLTGHCACRHSPCYMLILLRPCGLAETKYVFPPPLRTLPV